mgnify:FL=1|jgi:hypothetical protein|tara:strand:+ start:723 stop:1013 length:291 start_codon:yes stop_codon:yes gene_type:complete
MAITKETEVPKIEVVGSWNVQVATDTVIKEDDKEISRSRHRHVLQPYESEKGEDGKWTHTDTDISKEATEVQAVANAVWTDTVKANYKTFVESQEI